MNLENRFHNLKQNNSIFTISAGVKYSKINRIISIGKSLNDVMININNDLYSFWNIPHYFRDIYWNKKYNEWLQWYFEKKDSLMVD